MTDQTHIRETIEQGIMVLTFDRPERKNALTLAMYTALAQGLERASADPAVRVVWLKGEGQCFTSGNDLQDFMQSPPSGEESPVVKFLRAIHGFNKPLVATVDGYAVGIGTTMLLHCDLVFASDRAKFQLPFVNLALVPEGGSSFLLTRTLGQRRASELLLLGEVFGGPSAERYGIVNRVLPAAELDTYASEQFAKLVTKPPAAVREAKRLMKSHDSDELLKVMLEEAQAFMERLSSPEVAEAISAFFEKRSPDYSQFE